MNLRSVKIPTPIDTLRIFAVEEKILLRARVNKWSLILRPRRRVRGYDHCIHLAMPKPRHLPQTSSTLYGCET